MQALITDTAKLAKNIAFIGKYSAKMDDMLHATAVSALVHAAQHNDPDLVNRLIASVGKSVRKQSLIKWVLDLGTFVAGDKPTDALKYNKYKRDLVLSEEHIAKLWNTPFWSYTEEKGYQQFDLMASLKALLGKVDKAAKANEQDAALLPPETVAKLREMVK